MNKQDLIVLKSRTLVLKNREISDEVVLTDPKGGDAFFRFEIIYISDEAEGKVRFLPSDDRHAKIEIDTTPLAVAAGTHFPIRIGTYEDKYPLFFEIVVQEQTPQTETHNVIVTFLRGKESSDGTIR